MKMIVVGASGRSPVSDFRLTSAGDLPPLPYCYFRNSRIEDCFHIDFDTQ
jgi:hypothetical protein